MSVIDWNLVSGFMKTSRAILVQQQPLPSSDFPSNCIGGHGTSPYEQKTQQSPCFGFSNSPQSLQSYNLWHALVGISSFD
jgi:hypothetical protein